MIFTIEVISLIVITLSYLITISLAGDKNWEFDLLNITFSTSDPNSVDLHYKVERISRGVYGFSGYINLYVHLDDNTTISAALYRSNTINGPFIKSPFSYNQSLSSTMNDIYKRISMENMRKCTVSGNAPYFEDKFVPPLTARSLVLEKCHFTTDEFPDNLQKGFYKFHIEVQHPFVVTTDYLVEIKNKQW